MEAGAASGLFNMMRNLGGAIGTAAVETFFTKREQFHSAIINEHVSLLQPTVELDKAPSIDVSAELPSAPVPPQRKSRGHRGGLRLAVYSVLAVLLILFSAGWAAISLGIIRITIQ